MLPTNIDGVLNELVRITDHCAAKDNRVALFAQVYWRVTREIKTAAARGEFKDNERMLSFDVMFANLFIKAFWEHEQKRSCSQVWQEFFSWSQQRLSIVQQVMLGMNAHINLDLGLAAARFMEGQRLEELRGDFEKVNSILHRLVNEMQAGIAKVSPLFFLLDWLGQNRDEELINFSMTKARQQAWKLATKLHSAPQPQREQIILLADSGFTLFGRSLAQPPSRRLHWILKLMAYFETQSLPEILSRWQEKSED